MHAARVGVARRFTVAVRRALRVATNNIDVVTAAQGRPDRLPPPNARDREAVRERPRPPPKRRQEPEAAAAAEALRRDTRPLRVTSAIPDNTR